jgi:hypothetical protein
VRDPKSTLPKDRFNIHNRFATSKGRRSTSTVDFTLVCTFSAKHKNINQPKASSATDNFGTLKEEVEQVI